MLWCYNSNIIEKELEMKNKKLPLNENEINIMSIFWTQDQPMIASDFIKFNPTLSIHIIQRTLKKLMDKEFIEVDKIVRSGKVFARSYKAKVTQEEYLQMEIQSYYPNRDKEIDFSKVVVAALLDEAQNDKKVIEELEKFIAKKKKELEIEH